MHSLGNLDESSSLASSICFIAKVDHNAQDVRLRRIPIESPWYPFSFFFLSVYTFDGHIWLFADKPLFWPSLALIGSLFPTISMLNLDEKGTD